MGGMGGQSGLMRSGRVLRLGLLCLLVMVATARAESEREAAVLLARAGHMDEALRRLRAMLAAGTEDPVVALDLVTLLQQAGQSAEAVAVWDRARPRDPPSYALMAATRAFRDQKRFDRAVELARSGMRRFPDEQDWPILLALVLTDDKRPDEALHLLATPAARRAPERERLLAEGYAARTANRPFEALRAYAAVGLRDPGNAEARDATRDILRGMRAPWGAARFAPPPIPPSIQGEMAAAEVRWGVEDRPFDPARRFEGTDRALANLDRLIALALEQDDPARARSLRLDRLVALRDRVRMADVVAEADALRQAGAELPAYARHPVADALLYLRQPEAARAAYESVLTDDPYNTDAQIGRFYATVEMEDFASAYQQADAMVANEPIWRKFADDPTRYARGQFLDATLLAGGVRVWGDQPAEGWARIEPVRDAAPASPSVRMSAAAAMSARNWPRAAEEENRIALSLAPQMVSAQIAVAESALARNRFAEARMRLADLVALYPENRAVQRLQRDYAARTGWILDIELRPSNETGGGTFGSNGNELNASTRIASPLIDDRWRVFAGMTFANAHPPEGYAQRQRYAAGIEFIWPDVTASVNVHQDLGSLSRTGLSGLLDWSVNDHLSVSLSAERISIETPLRALLYGITADSVNTRMTYAWNEGRSISIGAGWMPFTDGNQRTMMDVRFSQKVVAIPHFGLTAQAELYGSTNTRVGAPYYNPRTDGSASIGLVAEHMVWRRYERSMTQVVTLQGGWYGERDYTGGPVGTAIYEHRWRFDPWTELVYGASLGERIYDGQAARVIGAFITLRQRL